jgi:hypothetical protein
MGLSRATSRAATQPDARTSPSALLEFAISQAVSQEGAAPDAGSPPRESLRSSPPIRPRRWIPA